jgi:hypothetical protein
MSHSQFLEKPGTIADATVMAPLQMRPRNSSVKPTPDLTIFMVAAFVIRIDEVAVAVAMVV